MATQKNTAREAVQAEPCQKCPDCWVDPAPVDYFDRLQEQGRAERRAKCNCQKVVMPNSHQGMHMACAVVADSLHRAVKVAIGSGAWKDEYCDSINAAEIAHEALLALSAELPLDEDDFSAKWFRISSLVNLAANAFPDRDGSIHCHLQNAVREFTSMHDVVEFLRDAEDKLKEGC